MVKLNFTQEIVSVYRGEKLLVGERHSLRLLAATRAKYTYMIYVRCVLGAIPSLSGKINAAGKLKFFKKNISYTHTRAQREKFGLNGVIVLYIYIEREKSRVSFCRVWHAPEGVDLRAR